MLQALGTNKDTRSIVLPLYIGFYALCAVFLGLLTLALSWIIKRSIFPRLPYLVLLAISTVSSALFLPAFHLNTFLLWLVRHPLEALVSWRVETALLSPVTAGVLWAFEWGVEILRPRNLQEYLEQQTRLLEKKNEQLSHAANKLTQRDAPDRPDLLALGAFIKGDTFPDYLDIRREGQWVTLSDRIVSQHLLVIGTTGAGKTVTLTRLIAETLRATNRDIFVVDGKGDKAWAFEIANLMYSAGHGAAPIFTLGQAETGSCYHGFSGSKEAIYNRLVALVGVEEAEGNASYYADVNRDLLQLVCFAPGGAPRSFEEVRARLSKDWLAEAYKDDPIERETVEQLDNRAIQGLLVRVRPLVREFAPLVGAEGFALENTRGAIFSLRTQSVGDSARRFLHFLVEDLKDFVGNRQKRPGLLVIDEFGTFDNDNIVSLLSLARSANLGVILATQDIASLGNERTTQLILANTRTKILMASDFPEQLAKLAGTIYQIEASIQHLEGDPTGVGSARVQHTYRVDLNEAARLQAGEAFVIRQRHAVKVKIKAATGIGHNIQAVAHFTKGKQQPPSSVSAELHTTTGKSTVPDLEL